MSQNHFNGAFIIKKNKQQLFHSKEICMFYLFIK